MARPPRQPPVRIPSAVKRRVKHLAGLHFARLSRAVYKTDGRHPPPNQSCLYWTVAAVLAARDCGLDAMPQAGTAGWRCVADCWDDGETATRFCYQYDQGAVYEVKDQIFWMRAGFGLPEVHCWAVARPAAAGRDDWHILDLTTRYVPRLFLTCGTQPVSRVPPSAVFDRPDDLAAGSVQYQAAFGACWLFQAAVQEFLQHGVLTADEFVALGGVR